MICQLIHFFFHFNSNFTVEIRIGIFCQNSKTQKSLKKSLIPSKCSIIEKRKQSQCCQPNHVHIDSLIRILLNLLAVPRIKTAVHNAFCVTHKVQLVLYRSCAFHIVHNFKQWGRSARILEGTDNFHWKTRVVPFACCIICVQLILQSAAAPIIISKKEVFVIFLNFKSENQ